MRLWSLRLKGGLEALTEPSLRAVDPPVTPDIAPDIAQLTTTQYIVYRTRNILYIKGMKTGGFGRVAYLPLLYSFSSLPIIL